MENGQVLRVLVNKPLSAAVKLQSGEALWTGELGSSVWAASVIMVLPMLGATASHDSLNAPTAETAAFFAARISRRSNRADFVAADCCSHPWPNNLFGAQSGFVSSNSLAGLPEKARYVRYIQLGALTNICLAHNAVSTHKLRGDTLSAKMGRFANTTYL